MLNDFFARRLLRVSIADGKVSEVASDLGGADGLARDKRGRIYVSDWGKGRVFVIDDANSKPRVLLEGFKAPADLTVDPYQDRLLIPDMRAGTLTAVSLEEVATRWTGRFAQFATLTPQLTPGRGPHGR